MPQLSAIVCNTCGHLIGVAARQPRMLVCRDCCERLRPVIESLLNWENPPCRNGSTTHEPTTPVSPSES